MLSPITILVNTTIYEFPLHMYDSAHINKTIYACNVNSTEEI